MSRVAGQNGELCVREQLAEQRWQKEQARHHHGDIHGRGHRLLMPDIENPQVELIATAPRSTKRRAAAI